MKKLRGIQYLRAFAALGVVAFHATERMGGNFAIGAAGVDVFFVVSGFIMWIIARERPPTPTAFLLNRLKRIAPSYWAATTVMVAGGIAGLFPHLVLTPDHILESLFFIPHRSPNGGEIWPVLVQGWTLNYEIFFYAVFAASLLLAPRRRLPALVALFGSLGVLGLFSESGNPLLLTYTDPIILEFVAGAVIGHFWLEGRIGQSPLPGLALVAIAIAGFTVIGLTLAAFNSLSFGILSVLLVTGVLMLENGDSIGHSRVAVYLGDASYSIYLWHTFAISVAARMVTLLSRAAGAGIILASLAGTTLGVAFFELFEKPVGRALRGRRNAGPRAHAIIDPLQHDRAAGRGAVPAIGDRASGFGRD
jgi:exopolysaccharide production protein ExoZ